MKKLKKILLVGLVLTTVMSCEDFSDYNVDPKNPQKVPAGALFANSTKTLFDFMTEINVNVNNFRLWSQQWAQTTYADESNYDLITRNVNGAAWNTLYSDVIRDLNDAKMIINSDEYRVENPLFDDVNVANQTAMAEVLEIFAWHVLVDIFGDIPYTDAFTEDVTPAYDDDLTIYDDLVTRLDAAIATLTGESNFANYDLVYGGNVGLWRKFANSIKLRLALRIAQVNNTKAQTMVEQALNPANGGVIAENDENFMLHYEGSTPNTNPLWVSLIQSGRSDFVAASTLVDPMNELNDPRLFAYFDRLPFGYSLDDDDNLQDSTFTTNGMVFVWENINGEDSVVFLTGNVTIDADDADRNPRVFKGGVYGDNNAFNTLSHPGELQEDPTFPGIILSYWEIQFLLADFAQRGYAVGGTPEEFYNEGIAASIEYWGGTPANITAYLAQPDVAFTTAPGSPFERIAFQKWIALYDQGFEAWSTYRIYDYPTMAIAVLSELPTPTRYTYPVTEYSLNEVNVAAAGEAIGGDGLETRVFWDVD